MAMFGRTEIGLTDTSTDADVPDHPKAKLMYYLNCVCSVLEVDDNEDINRLRRYSRYYTLDNSDTNLLIHLCVLLSPKELLNKCFIQDDALCGDSGNKFYNLQTVKKNFLIAGNIVIGGQNRQVQSIMAFKMSWLRENWEIPITTLMAEQQRIREEAMRRQTTPACVIL